ncbi:MAG: hypothetical protein K5648_07000 [Erysipelotrichaceae bacterium]|nr:hypothetical protein [Erysipelotrichaceae bacterium]
MKKMIKVLLVLAMVLGASACASQKEEEQKAPEVPAEESETVKVPEELLGSYHEEIAGRASLELSENKITIDWSSSAFEKAHFDFDIAYDADKNQLTYVGGKRTDTVFESDTKSTVTEAYNDGSGNFAIEEGKLIWNDDKNENGGPVVFISNEETAEIGMANPWSYTGDLEEAITGSSIEFDPPVSVPDGFVLTKYGYNINGIIEANYESEDRKLTVRKSDLYEGLELSGDYNTYSHNWQESLKGLAVDLYGDGESINLALFSGNNAHYSVTVTDKEYKKTEGNGISIDELSSLVMGMQ